MNTFFYKTESGKSPVEEMINKEDVKTQAKITTILDYFRKYGLHLPQRYLKRMVGTKKLWEIRIKYRKQYRIFTAVIENENAILLHGFIKKTQKTPEKEIKTAEERLNKFYLSLKEKIT